MSSIALFLLLWLHGGNGGAPAPAAHKAPVPAPAPARSSMIRPSWWTRDPFRPIVPPKPPGPPVRPSGRAGLSVDHLRVVAVALGGPQGPVAMVANTQGHTYFLRPGSAIYDAQVIRLESDGVWFERTHPRQGASALVFRKVS